MTEAGTKRGLGNEDDVVPIGTALPHLGRVPIPFGIAGSSIFTGIGYQTREHNILGGRTTVITSHNREGHIEGADNLPADYTRYCPREWFTRREELTDHVLGAVGLKRHYYGRNFIPAIELLHSVHPDVVLLHEGHYATASLPHWRKMWPDGKFVLYVHSPVSRSYGSRELRALLGYADLAVFVSDYGRQRLARRARGLPIPSAVVHNGLDPEIFHPRGRKAGGERLRVAFAGEVAPYKGVHLLLSAVEPLKDSVELTIVGSRRHEVGVSLSEYEVSLREQARTSGMKVAFTPFVNPDKLADIFRSSDVVCVPSTFEEPFGRVAIEAMACGAAVIASNRGGLPEACGGAARLVNPEDIRSFTDAISEFLDGEVLQSFRNRSVERGDQLSWRRSHAQLMHGLSRIL